jgi:hypothetical protein
MSLLKKIPTTPRQFVKLIDREYGRNVTRAGLGSFTRLSRVFAALEDCISILEINAGSSSLTKYERACFIDKARMAAE